LAVIHEQGIYHRDLKPDNIMLRRGARAGEELVLIDFSIAIVRDPDQTVHGLSRAAGTLLYMAPEQAVGFACAASDIYSLAKVLVEMLSGKTVVELFPDASLDLPGRVRKYLAAAGFGLSSEAIELIAQALEFDPMKRPADALRFVEPVVRDLGARGASA
jgi:eukaryotic-like serine/threonine-protein kinase